jgi:hypothetical protein
MNTVHMVVGGLVETMHAPSHRVDPYPAPTTRGKGNNIVQLSPAPVGRVGGARDGGQTGRSPIYYVYLSHDKYGTILLP